MVCWFQEADHMDYDALLNMGTELGYQLMYSGAEIYRVEELSLIHI